MFSHRNWLHAAALAGLLCTLIAVSIRADEFDFSVDDYIPELFKDFEWQLSAGAQLQGNDHEDEESTLSMPHYSDKRQRTTDNQLVSLGTFLQYRYETVPRFLTLTLSASGNYTHETQQSSVESETYVTSRNIYSHNDFGENEYFLALTPSLDAGQYLSGDFFLSSLISAWMQTGGEFTGNSDGRNETTSFFSDDSVRVSYNESLSDNTDDRKIYQIDARLMPGWGHVYEGNYATAAMYMVDELRREGLLRRNPSREEMRELCDLVYYYRLKHPVDTRLLKIETLKEIADYFIDQGIIDDPGPYGYLLIQDVWDFFPHMSRPFGFRFRLGPGIDFSYDRYRRSQDRDLYRITYEYDSDTPSDIDTVSLSDERNIRYESYRWEHRWTYLGLLAEYRKPLDLRWQIDAAASARYYPNAYSAQLRHRIEYTQGSVTDDYFRDLYLVYNAFYELDLSGAIRYIVNSRTASELGIGYHRSHFNSSIQEYRRLGDGGGEQLELPARYDSETDQLSFMGSLVYRISIPTRLTVQLGYEISNSDILDEMTHVENYHSYVFSVGLSHYLY